MTSDSVTWQEFDPEAGELPVGLASLEQGDSVAALTLLAAPHARRDGWAARAGLGIAAALGRNGTPVLLADLDLRRPELHRVTGLPNDEGITDLLLWGASLDRIARPAREPQVSLLSAGTVVPDPERVFTDPHWDEVAHQVRRAGQALMLYLPQDEPGALELARRSSAVVVLAAPGESEVVLSDLGGLSVQAVLGPASSPATSGDEEEEAAVPGTPVKEAEPAAKEARRERPGRRVGIWVLIVVLALVAGLLLADGFGLMEIPFAP